MDCAPDGSIPKSDMGVWPMTFQERQMVAEQYLRPDSTAYHISFALRLSGALDGARLEKSLKNFANRHRIMRSFYPVENGEIAHKISEGVTAVLERKSFRPEGADFNSPAFREFIRSLDVPFDLSRAPLFKFYLIEAGEKEHVLLFWIHHIIMDGFSVGIFIRDLRELYENGGEYRTPADSPDYLDYAAWEAERGMSEEREREDGEKKKFLLDMFADGVPENEMPSKPSRPAKLPVASAHEERRLDISGLRKEAARRGRTAFTLLLSAFGLTLGKYCNSDDAVLGLALGGRAAGTGDMIGMFVNTLPVRVKFSAGESADDYIGRVAGTIDAVKARQSCPLESLTPVLAPDRGESRNPIFDVIVNYINEYGPFEMDGVSVIPLPRILQELNIDLKLEMLREGDALRVVLSYSPELYDAEVVGGMLDHFEAVLEKISSAPAQSCPTVAEIAELPETQRKKILEDFAGERSDRWLGRTVVDLFRAKAAETPERVAVMFGDASLSYGELDGLTDKLAARLHETGTGRGDWVGILARRSEMMPLCGMGVLKSGASYVPLDPTYPSERLEFMLKDSGAGVVIVDEGLESIIPGFGGRTMTTGEIRAMRESPAPAALPDAPLPGDPLVLLYTSGTTGQPKGVILSHANLANFCDWYTRTYNISEADVTAAYASFGFDAHLMDLYPSLTAGAAVDIVPEEMRLDLPRINKRFNEKGVTVAFMTTQLGRQFAADMRGESLRALTVGGETLVPIKPPESFALYNAYGPTECTILSTLFKVDRLYDRVPLGRPPSNTAIYIVDKSGGLAPIGGAGELCVAGRQVGLGYLNRPELTEEKFVKNPFSDDPDYAKMYKTGDVARFLPSGDVDFIGRKDFQVKIRGFRVELSEIELRIRACPDVKDAAVVPLDAPGGGKCAVAYVVSDTNIDAEKLNRFIEMELPPYMVPAAVVQVDAIPLNANGKVDRRKLPPPEFGAADADAPEDAANEGAGRAVNDLETAIRETLTDVIGHGRFNLHTNLIRVGLTSLAAIRFCAKLDERLGVAPPVPEIMKSPTPLDIENAILRKLLNERVSAAAFDGGRTEDAGKAGGYDDKTGYPLSQSQAGVCFECMKRPDSTVYNIPFRVSFHPSANGTPPDARRLAEAVAAVIDAHPVVKSRLAEVSIAEGGGEIRQFPIGAPAAVPCVSAGDDELEGIARDFIRPFNLFEGPLYRAQVVGTPSGATLMADFHHIVFDGSSLEVFLRDLEAVFDDSEFLRKNRAAREKITCVDWAAREKNEEGSADWLADKAYFDGEFAGFEGASEITPDLSGGRDERGESAEVVRVIGSGLIEEFSRANGTTAAGLLLAALAYAAARWTCGENVCLATISSGRSDPGLKNSFGMFVRTLPLTLRTKESGVVSSLDFVRSCQRKLTDATLHERYPFARAAQEHGFEPSILYACQLGLSMERRVGGEPVSVELLASGDPKFKLTVFAEERGGEPAYVLQYDAALYSSSIMERFADTLVTALENIAARPHAPLAEVSLVSAAAGKLMEKFNDTAGGRETTLTDMFASAVRKNPDKRALIAPDAEYTYSALNERANKLANALLAFGVEREDKVAFVMRRTSRVIVSMFGILKAGCAYIPIDPDYPAERIRHVLSESAAKFILTTPDTRETAEAAIQSGQAGRARALDFDTFVDGADAGEPGVSVTPDMLAYILFTSGSTGKPKGVMLEHRGIANFIADDELNTHVRALTRADCVMMSITTIAFDMFGIETLLTLCNGLTTVLADDDAAKDPVRLAELFGRTGADAIDSTPTRLLEYSEYGPLLDALNRCKVIILGGEKYPAMLLARLKKGRKFDGGLFNIYGPTEISIACNGRDLSGTDHITVGPPLLNVREVVADSDGNALPPGVVGELWVGGRGVGRGYVNMPEITAERFVTRGGERFYRCGDFARWTEDGEIEILGRNDNQIKLRGLRIELGEVESALSSIGGVRSCAVMIRNIRNSDHLCAYYVADGDLEPDKVREQLAKSLTPYMAPTAYLRLLSMPKTPNDKNDLKALPEPELLKATGYEAPKTALEEAVCSIFARVLGAERVGAGDSFFDIGGSSLTVTRVVVEAREKGLSGLKGASISYADVFAHPTPRELAALLAGGGSDASPPEPDEPSYDYGPIHELLSKGTVEAFRSGPRRPLGSVLLTGATGFLGAHVLRALLDEGEGAVFCMLRRGREPAEDRLKNMLFYYFEDDFAAAFGGKLHAKDGDITAPESLSALAGLPVDTIVNCAANVTHFAKDTSITDVNLGGVRNLIDFAARKKARLIQVSTASVAGFSVEGVPPDESALDETMLYFGQNLENQYIHSKFAAERAVLEAVLGGLDAKIMRIGNLMARSRDGEFQINAAANSFLGRLRAYQTVGLFPYSACMERAELSPIDSTAKAVLLLASAPSECVVFHPFSNYTFCMGDIVEIMRDEGLKIDFAEDAVFERALAESMRDKNKAERLVSLIAYQNVAQGRRATPLGAKNDRTSQELRRLNWRWPEATDEYLRHFLRGMIRLGYFDAESR